MRMAETAFQADTFLAFAAVGLLSALLYDLCTPIFRSRYVPAHVAADFLLGAFTMTLCFFALAMTDRGEMRFYMALALFLGALLYRLGIHRLFAWGIKLWNRNRNPGKRSE